MGTRTRLGRPRLIGNEQVPRDIIVQREMLVWEYRQKGYTLRRIAEETGLDSATVGRYLSRIAIRTRKAIEEDINRIRYEQVIILDRIADEALQAWELSKKATKSLSKRSSTGHRTARSGNGDADDTLSTMPREEVITKVEEQQGDPRYLTEARAAMADIRKILGIDAPTKHLVGIKDFTKMTEEELRQIAGI